MKKFLWIAILLALTLAFIGCPADDDDNSVKCEYEDCDCADCEGEGCECKKPKDDNKPEPLVIDNPKFTGWGGAGSEGVTNTFNFDTGAEKECRITYVFPAEAAAFTHFEITYSVTRNEENNDPDKKMKLVIKDGNKDDWDNASKTYESYPEYSNDTSAATYSHAITTKKQLTIEHNRFKNETTSFTITITKIRFFNQ